MRLALPNVDVNKMFCNSMGTSQSKQETDFKLDKDGKLTQEQFVYIMDNYMLATRLFGVQPKYAKVNKEAECHQRYFIECGKQSKTKLKKHGISSLVVCMSQDYSLAMYTVNRTYTHVMKFDAHQMAQLATINKKLQPYNGYGSDSPCYKS